MQRCSEAFWITSLLQYNAISENDGKSRIKPTNNKQLRIAPRPLPLSLPSPPPIRSDEITTKRSDNFHMHPPRGSKKQQKSWKKLQETQNLPPGQPSARRLHTGFHTLPRSFGDWSSLRYSQDTHTQRRIVGGFPSPLPPLPRVPASNVQPTAFLLFCPFDFDALAHPDRTRCCSTHATFYSPPPLRPPSTHCTQAPCQNMIVPLIVGIPLLPYSVWLHDTQHAYVPYPPPLSLPPV